MSVFDLECSVWEAPVDYDDLDSTKVLWLGRLLLAGPLHRCLLPSGRRAGHTPSLQPPISTFVHRNLSGRRRHSSSDAPFRPLPTPAHHCGGDLWTPLHTTASYRSGAATERTAPLPEVIRRLTSVHQPARGCFDEESPLIRVWSADSKRRRSVFPRAPAS